MKAAQPLLPSREKVPEGGMRGVFLHHGILDEGAI